MLVPTPTQRAGFSLIELMIAMTIIALLAVIMWLEVDGANDRAYVASIQADLRAVSVAQELYHHAHMRYGPLSELESYIPSEGVTVTVTHADNRSFAAVGTHAGLGGVTCGFFVGNIPDGAADPAEEAGEIVCD